MKMPTPAVEIRVVERDGPAAPHYAIIHHRVVASHVGALAIELVKLSLANPIITEREDSPTIVKNAIALAKATFDGLAEADLIMEMPSYDELAKPPEANL